MKLEEKILLIKAAIYEMGLLFNQQPNDDRITAYAKALQNYTPQQIKHAFNQVILSGSAFFPSLAEILTHLRPSQEKKEDLAPVIANEIIQFIRMHHYDLEANYFHTLSKNAQAVLKQLGDTRNLRNSENFETMRAQLERSVKGLLSFEEANSKAAKLESIGIKTGRVLDFPLRTMDFSGFLPNGTEEK